MPKVQTSLESVEDCQRAAADLARRGRDILVALRPLLLSTANAGDHAGHAHAQRLQTSIFEFALVIESLSTAS
jgi:hypothetical protein